MDYNDLLVMHKDMKQSSGFTLIELSVVLALIGVILYGSITLLTVGIQTSQVNSTIATMDAIEKALLNYRVAFGRIPCPSDLTATASSANYGREAANPGTCTGGSPAANFIAASGTAEGGVPIRALRLPDSYMYDGWGHKLRYAVNTNYTVTSSTSCSLSTNPFITINDASGAARSTAAVYAIVSHGANGHGAYTSNGIVVNSGSTNADELTNCHCTSTGAANTYSPAYVQKMPTEATAGNPLTTFDDIVTYREAWQEMTPNLSTNSWGCTFAGYARTITIDHTKVGTVNNTDQSNFPVLFSGTYSYLATTAHGGLVQNANGYDITFTSDAAGTHLLPFERESWNAATGASVFWVQVPTVSHTTDTVIYLQYGNPNITTDQSNKTGTWDSYYSGVWHMDETSGTAYDSTSNANNFTTTHFTAQGETTTAKFNGADEVDSASDVSYTSGLNASLLPANFTIEGWFNFISFNSGSGNELIQAINNGSPGWYSSYLLLADAGHHACLYWENTSLTQYQSCGSTALSTGTWYHIASTYNGSNGALIMYVNGSLVNTTTTSGSMYQANNHLQLGDAGTAWNPFAYFDELRISSTNRSSDWIGTEYNNYSAPDKATYGASGFYTVGSQQSR